MVGADIALDLAEILLLFAGISPDMSVVVILHMLTLLPPLIYVLATKEGRRGLRFCRVKARDAVLCVCIAVMLYLVLSGMLLMLSGLIVQSGGTVPSNATDAYMQTTPLVVYFAFYCLFPPLTEECIFRGALQNHFESRLGGVALLVSTVYFAILHADPLSMLNAFFAGLVLGLVYVRTRSLWAPVIVHGLFNFFASSGVLDEYVLLLPWETGTLSMQTLTFDAPVFRVYVGGMMAAALLLLWAFLRLLALRSDNKMKKQPVLHRERVGAPAAVFFVLAGLRAVTASLAYF